MPRTRVLLVGLPRLLNGVVRGLVDQDGDLEIVGESDPVDMVSAVASMAPDVALVGNAQSGVPRMVSLIASHPTLRIITIEKDGRSATVHYGVIAPITLKEVSANSLLDMMRGKARTQ